MNLTTATPVEIDTALAEIYVRTAKARYDRDLAWSDTVRYVEKYLGLPFRQSATAQQITDALVEIEETAVEARDWNSRQAFAMAEKHEALAEQVNEVIMEAEPFDTEYQRRGGWTRAFLVSNNGGHVHSSMACSTCFPTTQFHWLPEYSGKPEAEIVEDAGERACTVCYPSAPVDVLRRPTKIFSEDEKKAQQAREERASKKAAAEAAQITFTWTEYGRTQEKTFKTLRAATNALASALGSLCWYGTEHSSAAEWLANVEAGRKALGDSWDYDKALAAARKKSVKDAGTGLHEEVVDFDPQTRKYITRWSDTPLYPKF